MKYDFNIKLYKEVNWVEMKTLAHSRKARKPQSLWLCTLREMMDGFTFGPDRLVKCMASVSLGHI